MTTTTAAPRLTEPDPQPQAKKSAKAEPAEGTRTCCCFRRCCPWSCSACCRCSTASTSASPTRGPGSTRPTHFTGLANYAKLWHDALFWQSFRIGLIWAFGVTIIQFFLALGLASLLNQPLRMRWLARTLALVPWAMPPVIVGDHVEAGLPARRRPALQRDLQARLRRHVDRLAQQPVDTALPAVIVVGVWAGMPQTTVTLLAGLQGVPAELHEAAAVDGAGRVAAVPQRHAARRCARSSSRSRRSTSSGTSTRSAWSTC